VVTSRSGRFIHGNESWHLMNRRLGGSQSRFGRSDEDKNVFPRRATTW